MKNLVLENECYRRTWKGSEWRSHRHEKWFEKWQKSYKIKHVTTTARAQNLMIWISKERETKVDYYYDFRSDHRNEFSLFVYTKHQRKKKFGAKSHFKNSWNKLLLLMWRGRIRTWHFVCVTLSQFWRTVLKRL